jgi:hypothetical protein
MLLPRLLPLKSGLRIFKDIKDMRIFKVIKDMRIFEEIEDMRIFKDIELCFQTDYPF